LGVCPCVGSLSSFSLSASLPPLLSFPTRRSSDLFVLLNGASGIAVGLATEIPSHNLREVAAATVALIRNDKLADDELFELLQGRSEEHTSELQSRENLVCRLLLEKKKNKQTKQQT